MPSRRRSATAMEPSTSVIASTCDALEPREGELVGADVFRDGQVINPLEETLQINPLDKDGSGAPRESGRALAGLQRGDVGDPAAREDDAGPQEQRHDRDALRGHRAVAVPVARVRRERPLQDEGEGGHDQRA